MNDVGVKFLLDLDESGFEGGMKGAIKSVSSLGAGLVSLNVGTDIISSLGKSAVDMSITFEQSFSKVSTLFGDVAVDTDLLQDKILNLSNTSGIAATELNEGLYSALSAGIPVTEDMNEAMNFLIASTRLSVAGFTSVEKAVDVATTVLNAYGLEVDQTNRVMNTLIETQNAGKTTVDELASSIGKAIPTAASLGVNFEELSASLAVTTANGIGTAESVTMLNALFREMNDSGSQVNKMFEELNGKSIADFLANGGSFLEVLTQLNDALVEQNKKWGDILTSSESVTAAQTLMKDGGVSLSETYERMTDDVYELDGAYQSMQTTQQNLNKIQQGVNNEFINLGDIIMDKASPAIELIAENIYWLAPLGVTLAVVVGALAVVFGIAAIAAGVMALGLVPLIGALIAAALPVIGIAILIGILVVAFYKAAEATGTLGTIIQIFGEIAKITFLITAISLYMLGAVFKVVFTAISNVIAKFLQFFQPEMELIATILSLVTEFLLAIIKGDWEEAFNIATQIVEVFTSYFESRFPNVYEAAENTILMVSALLRGDWKTAFEYGQKVVQSFVDFVKNILPDVGEVLQTVVDTVNAIIVGDWTLAWENFKKIPISMINLLIGGIESGLNSIVRGINSFVSSIAGIANAVPGVNIDIGDAPSVNLPRIPYFAKGGVVNGAGLGVIGEAGPEMILPLNNQGADFIKSVMPQLNGGGDITITMEFGDLYGIQNAEQIINEAVDVMDEKIGRIIKRKG